jgi:hypothetical protein
VSYNLEVRRVLTTNLHVTEPRYLPVNVKAEVKVWKKATATGLVTSTTEVEQEIEAKITKFLHPLYGGPDGTGWDVGQDLTLSGLFEYIQPEPELGFISEITIEPNTPLYEPPDRPYEQGAGVWVQVADYEIICSGDHTIKAEEIGG